MEHGLGNYSLHCESDVTSWLCHVTMSIKTQTKRYEWALLFKKSKYSALLSIIVNLKLSLGSTPSYEKHVTGKHYVSVLWM